MMKPNVVTIQDLEADPDQTARRCCKPIWLGYEGSNGMACLMVKKQSYYQSYLLRLWVDSDTENLVWHASLKESLSGELWGFASLNALFAFLRQQTEDLAEKRFPPGEDEAI